jgi:hypothetical protein
MAWHMRHKQLLHHGQWPFFIAEQNVWEVMLYLLCRLLGLHEATWMQTGSKLPPGLSSGCCTLLLPGDGDSGLSLYT